jgi:hypothetical protein
MLKLGRSVAGIGALCASLHFGQREDQDRHPVIAPMFRATPSSFTRSTRPMTPLGRPPPPVQPTHPTLSRESSRSMALRVTDRCRIPTASDGSRVSRPDRFDIRNSSDTAESHARLGSAGDPDGFGYRGLPGGGRRRQRMVLGNVAVTRRWSQATHQKSGSLRKAL